MGPGTVLSPEEAAWVSVPDMAALRAYSWPINEVDFLRWAADQIN